MSDDDVKPLDVEHLTWLIEGRAANQKASVKLLRSLRSGSKKLKTEEFQIIAQKLVAVAFSLWRAVFLADRTADKNGLKHADNFLEKVIIDNAINYVQDRNARDWSFGYYMSNARFQLDQLSDRWPDLYPEGTRPRKPQRRWDHYQKAFENAVDQFEKDLGPDAQQRK
jgi:hypothetical protein